MSVVISAFTNICVVNTVAKNRLVCICATFQKISTVLDLWGWESKVNNLSVN